MNPPVRPAIKAGEAATGNTPYQSPPSVAPSGNEAIAACWAMTVASAGPSTRAPGVACLRVKAPAPSAISVVVISAAAALVSDRWPGPRPAVSETRDPRPWNQYDPQHSERP